MKHLSLRQPLSWARLAFVLAAAVFTASVAVQIFIAGLATFVNPVHWANHTSFVHFIEPLALLVLVLAFVAKLPNAVRWQCGGLLALIFVQYITANVTAVLPQLAATHPVFAMLIFWLALRVTSAAWRLNRYPPARI